MGYGFLFFSVFGVAFKRIFLPGLLILVVFCTIVGSNAAVAGGSFMTAAVAGAIEYVVLVAIWLIVSTVRVINRQW